MLHIARKSTHNIEHFIVEKHTGEILGSYTIHALPQTTYDYTSIPTTKNQPAHLRYDLDPNPRREAVEIVVEALPDGAVDLDAQRSKRGPKPKALINQNASHFKVAQDERLGWVDDYVFGACITVAGVHKGTLNVSPSHVLRACLLNEISTEIVKRVIRLEGLRTMSDQQARRICQCARFAIGGMEIYLERNPTVRQELQFEVDFANSYHENNADILKAVGGDEPPAPVVLTAPVREARKIPQQITELYNAGEYLAYGEALRTFRRGLTAI
ncbi:hypothetical protein [Pseudomonas sp. P5_C3]